MEFDRGIRTDLLDPVAEMRLAIMEAAIDCNYDRRVSAGRPSRIHLQLRWRSLGR